MTKREIERIVRALCDKQGVRARKTKSGYVLYLPDGTTAGLHLTPSDNHAMRNFRARIRRSGLEWPG